MLEKKKLTPSDNKNSHRSKSNLLPNESNLCKNNLPNPINNNFSSSFKSTGNCRNSNNSTNSALTNSNNQSKY